ncbi:hypothetical protein ACT3RT_13960 [Ewingella sp. AOP9-I1-14]
MSKPDTSANVRQLNEQQIKADMQRQAQYDKHRVKLEALREYIRENGPAAGTLASEQINKAFDAITL